MSSVCLIYHAVEFHGCFCEELELKTTLTFCGVPPSDLRTVQPIPRAAIMLTPAFFFNLRLFSAIVSRTKWFSLKLFTAP